MRTHTLQRTPSLRSKVLAISSTETNCFNATLCFVEVLKAHLRLCGQSINGIELLPPPVAATAWGCRVAVAAVLRATAPVLRPPQLLRVPDALQHAPPAYQKSLPVWPGQR